jgi:glycosyltransferase involved in cell wall biosynthesis
MKILILNTHDMAGGAARAARRLHGALRSLGVNSTMLVQFKSSDDPSIIGPQKTLPKTAAIIRALLDALPTKFYRKKKQVVFSPACCPNGRLLRTVNHLKPDLVHLHWGGAGFVAIGDLPDIRSPLVWTLHDMWAFTGGCHYDTGCGRYLKGCGACPVLGSNTPHDLSRWVFRRKAESYSRLRRLTVVGPSRWIADNAKSSLLLGTRHVVHLPNPIDTQGFHRMDSSSARKLWKLPLDKKLILFGAPKATSDDRKGWRELRDGLSCLDLHDAELVLFGAGQPDNLPAQHIPGHYVGKLHDDVSLATLYSACDVVVVPSRQENLSNVIMESLACGTPVVAFRLGGNADMVQHGVNGYLAEPHNSRDLARGIEWILKDCIRWQELSMNARQKAERDFDSRRVAVQYTELYKKVIKEAYGLTAGARHPS